MNKKKKQKVKKRKKEEKYKRKKKEYRKRKELDKEITFPFITLFCESPEIYI